MSANQVLYDRIEYLETALGMMLDAGKAIQDGWAGDLSDAMANLASAMEVGESTLKAGGDDDAPPVAQTKVVVFATCEHQCPDGDLRCTRAPHPPETHMATDADGRTYRWGDAPLSTFEVRR